MKQRRVRCREKGRRLDPQGSPLRRIGTGKTSHSQTPTVLQRFLEAKRPESHEHWPVSGSARDEKERARGMKTRGEWGPVPKRNENEGLLFLSPSSSRPLLRVFRGAWNRLPEHQPKYLGSLSAEGPLQV